MILLAAIESMNPLVVYYSRTGTTKPVASLKLRRKQEVENEEYPDKVKQLTAKINEEIP
jgi:hypothetical protein